MMQSVLLSGITFYLCALANVPSDKVSAKVQAVVESFACL